MKIRKMSLSILFLSLFISFLTAQDNYVRSALDNLMYKQNYRALRSSSAAENLKENGDDVSIDAGKSLVIADLKGPGVITHIWMTISSLNPFYSRSVVIRIYWDDNDKPSVEAPIGDFFGVGHGADVPLTSAVVSTSSNGRARNCYWKMPFKKRAKITITNESGKYGPIGLYYYIDWQKHDKLPQNILYFHAQYKQQFPAKHGDYTILETKGSGLYAGVVYSAQNMELGWFGEGDDRIYVDGESYPSLSGTGTEDYFGDAWGFRHVNRPYYGVSLWEGYYPGDRTSAYRWHIPDPVPFNKSIKVAIEHKGSVYTDEGVSLTSFAERQDWLSSVAFWYQSTPASFDEAMPPAEKRIAPYKVLPVKQLSVRGNPSGAVKESDVGVSFMPMKADATLEIDFKIEKPGRYQINAIIQHSLFSGKYQAFLDGKALGGIMDLCASGEDPVWHGFDLHDLAQGKHTLKFTGKGASPKMRSLTPPVYSFGIHYLILLRLEDMQGYHEALKKLTKSRK